MTTLVPKVDFKNGGSTPTGAVNRTSSEKLQDIVCAKDFGVVGNGTTDDTAALQAFFNQVTTNGRIGIITAGEYKVTAPLTISITSKSFSIQGAGAQSTVIVAASTFSGGTKVLQVTGNGTAVSWDMSAFSIQGSYGSTGSATTGFEIGNSASATIGLLGYNFSLISQVYVTGFATLWNVVHARMIHFEDCAGWGNEVTNQVCLNITQNGAFTGDLYFERCQFVNKNDTGNKCVSITSPVGPYNFSTGFNSIAGIKFSVCDFYAGEKGFYVQAAAASAIGDIWLMPGCQFDQETTNAIWFESFNANTIVENININSCYINKSSSDTITFTSTGTGGTLRSLMVENCDILQAQAIAINFFAPAANLVNNVFVNNNSITDAVTPSNGAIFFNDATGVQVEGNSAQQGYGAGKPKYLIEFTSGTTGITCIGNFNAGNTVTALILDSSGSVPKTIANNTGYNPVAAASLSLGASPYTYTNTSGSPQIASFGGSAYTFTQLVVNGSFVTPAIAQQYMIPSGATMVVTYTGGLTAQIAGL
jgi:hypothetical protein